eukprot:scaffold314027_cov47-Attheya_sp.AAC.1
MQQKRMLHLKGDPNPKPRKQWAEDLSKQIGAWKKPGAEIMLCMHANADLLDPIAETGTGLNSRLTSSTYQSRVTGNSNAHTIRTPSRAE